MQSLQVITASPIENAIFQSNLTADDRQILTELLNQGNKSISLSVSSEIDKDELQHHLVVAGNAHGRLDSAISALKPVIGQMLTIVRDRPDIILSMGYRSFNDFMTNGATKTLNLSRSTVYACLKLATDWAGLEVDRYKRIGPSKMDLLMRVTKESNSNSEELLRAAEDPGVTGDMLRHRIAEMGLGNVEQLTGTSITIKCELALRHEFEEMLEDPILRDGLGITTPAELQRALIGDAKSSLYMQARANLGL